jgi:hypothetical protein
MNDGTVVPSSVLFHLRSNSTRWRAIPMSSQWTSLNSCTRLERAWGHALPGHEAADRDEMQRALRRLLRD